MGFPRAQCSAWWNSDSNSPRCLYSRGISSFLLCFEPRSRESVLSESSEKPFHFAGWEGLTDRFWPLPCSRLLRLPHPASPLPEPPPERLWHLYCVPGTHASPPCPVDTLSPLYR